ncbi:MAG: 3-phosphoshikimate 1-carboxyvinyltransferase [Phycisphaerales bacterium]|nr:3-phosphoshikimate 1-carboxyvinyltransferase [Phycisphaerales bacterium]
MFEVFRQPVSQLPAVLEIPTLCAPSSPARAVELEIRPPGSKSLTNRALLLAALASGASRLRRPLLDADDAHRMLAALTQLGARFEKSADEDLIVHGVSGRWRFAGDQTTLNLNNAGTATRFLAAASLLAPAPVIIDGNGRMRQRPIGELGAALERMGAKVEYLNATGYPPMRISPPSDLRTLKTSLSFPTTQSSQFISALILISPWLPSGMTIRLTGEITSESYIAMTMGLLQRLGAAVRNSADMRIVRINGTSDDESHTGPAAGLAAFDLPIEPDASSATYFWGAAAILPNSRTRVLGLGDDSLQGDSDFPDLLAAMGATVTKASGSDPWIQVRSGSAKPTPIIADLADMPDTAMTLASVACFAEGTSVFKGLRTLRVKETDRIAAMQTELAKIGITITTPISGDDGALSLTPPPGGVDCSPSCPRVEFDTYDDHRMAMSLALIGLRRPNTFIREPGCVAKTYATFWRDFARLWGG